MPHGLQVPDFRTWGLKSSGSGRVERYADMHKKIVPIGDNFLKKKINIFINLHLLKYKKIGLNLVGHTLFEKSDLQTKKC